MDHHIDRTSSYEAGMRTGFVQHSPFTKKEIFPKEPHDILLHR